MRASSLAELVWLRPDRMPDAAGVTALLHRERPAVAFTYAHAGIAHDVASAPVAALAMTERRSTGRPFTPMAAVGLPSLVEDPTGELFGSELLVEELRRYPPARRYADSPMLCREHWWYLPRLIVSLDVIDVLELPARTGPEDHLLASVDAGRLDLGVATVQHTDSDVISLDPHPAVAPGAAVLLGQDASFPDLERWSQWRWRGRWDGSTLTVASRPQRVGLEPVPGLLQRWRAQRDLERRCRRAIPTP